MGSVGDGQFTTVSRRSYQVRTGGVLLSLLRKKERKENEIKRDSRELHDRNNDVHVSSERSELYSD